MEWREILNSKKLCVCVCTFNVCFVLECVMCVNQKKRTKCLFFLSLPPAIVLLCCVDLDDLLMKNSWGPFDGGSGQA